jgi:hypothetical protein
MFQSLRKTAITKGTETYKNRERLKWKQKKPFLQNLARIDLKVWLVGPEGYQMQIGPALGKGDISKSMIQDELETVPLCPILSINERNLAFMWVCGNSRIQLARVAHNTAVCVIRGRNCFSFLGEIARSGFSFDIPFYPATMDSIDKAKPSVRVGRKATGL